MNSGEDAILDCNAVGFPPPVITWKKDNQVMKKTERYVPSGNSLKMKIVRSRYPDDDAVFSCEAKNDFGNDSRDFVVIIPSEFKF